jgi:hypothetical protein
LSAHVTLSRLAPDRASAQDAAKGGPTGPPTGVRRMRSMEMAAGIVLILLSIALIAMIVRTVQANMRA